jgi:thiamine transporter ThiT
MVRGSIVGREAPRIITNAALAVRSAYPQDLAMALSRDVAWLLIALLVGVLVLPLLVYFTGISILGPYAKGGPGAFMSDFVGDLAHLRWFSWSLALGPLVIVALWRVVARSR